MPDTVRSVDAFLNPSTGLFKDNTTRDIQEQDLRDFALSSYRPQAFIGGRLTLESGVPLSTSEQTNKNVLYYTPFEHNLIGLYDGTSWKLHTFSELSITLSGLTPYRDYDVFIYDNSGTLTLELAEWSIAANGTITGATNASPIVITSAAHGLSVGQLVFITGVGGNTNANSLEGAPWRVIAVTTDTFSLGNESGSNRAGNATYTSGGNWYRADQVTARGAAIVYQDGVLCKTGALTRRYLGMIRTTNTDATRDSLTQRMVANAYNMLPRLLRRLDSASHTLQNVSVREWSTYGCRCYFVLANNQHAMVHGSVRDLGNSSYALVYIGVDGVSSNPFFLSQLSADNAAGISWPYPISNGFHYLNLREQESGNVLATLDNGSISAMVMQ